MSIFSLQSNIMLINLFTIFVSWAVLGFNSRLNFSFSVSVSNVGSKAVNFLNRQLRLVRNVLHLLRKWNSSSILDDGQYLQIRCATVRPLYLPLSIFKLCALIRNLVICIRWVLLRTRFKYGSRLKLFLGWNRLSIYYDLYYQCQFFPQSIFVSKMFQIFPLNH